MRLLDNTIAQKMNIKNKYINLIFNIGYPRIETITKVHKSGLLNLYSRFLYYWVVTKVRALHDEY